MRTLAALAVLVLGSACPSIEEEPPVPVPTHRGIDLDGHAVDLYLDRAESTWRLAEADGNDRAEGSFADADDGYLTGFLAFDGADRPLYGVDLPDRALVAELPGTDGAPRLLWAAATGVDVDVYRPLMTGNYTVFHVREDGTTTDTDYGFATVAEDGGFFLHWRDSTDLVFDELEFGDNQTDADSADVVGSWTVGGDHDQAFEVDVVGGEAWTGVTYPGWAIVLKAPELDGLLVALWSPLENNQQSIYDNIHRHLTVTRDGDTFGPPTPTLIEIFGDEGFITRIDADGQVEEIGISGRAPAFYVGNVISWVVGEDDDERLYQVQVGDVATFVTGGACLEPPPPGGGGGGRGEGGPGGPGGGNDCTDEEAQFRTYGLGAHFDF